MTLPTPTRACALEQLQDFIPRAGRNYARDRNHDLGPDQRRNVSGLSPYLRHRLITEQEVVGAVLEQHSPAAAEKFIQEVLWRTYWKGWLEMRPSVWHAFIDERDAQLLMTQDNDGLRRALAEAEAGQTGIEGFDHWARELTETGYLHNHARMWFASIWIFTLKLPWTLGADFFLRHLLDADPASNTLSWRWVAGLQTRGKTYLARADNIEKYTGQRFRPGSLANEAPPLDGLEPPLPIPLPEATAAAACPRKKTLLLITPEDLSPESLIPESATIARVVVVGSVDQPQPWPFGNPARDFVAGACEDALARAKAHFGAPGDLLHKLDSETLIQTCRNASVDCVLTGYAPVGPVADALNELSGALGDQGIQLLRMRREWDEQAWPHATRGFFAFRKSIPKLLKQVGLTDD